MTRICLPTITVSMSRSERSAPSRNTVWTRGTKVVAAGLGIVASGGIAFAATNWTVGLAANSAANAQGASIANLTFSKATSAPTLTNQLSPGSNGDVSMQVTNSNAFIVTITAITIPIESGVSPFSNNAIGYSDAATNTAIAGCGPTTSTVTWKGAGATAVSKPITPVTIAAGATITLTLTNDATMDTTAPLVCAGTQSGSTPNFVYAGANFVMPSLTTITATGGVYSGQTAATANNGTATSTY